MILCLVNKSYWNLLYQLSDDPFDAIKFFMKKHVLQDKIQQNLAEQKLNFSFIIDFWIKKTNGEQNRIMKIKKQNTINNLQAIQIFFAKKG